MLSITAPMCSVATATDDLVTRLSNGAARDLSHEELGDLVVAARRVQARLESVVLAAVAEVDARRSHVHDGALTAGAWLRMLTRATPAEAAATVRTGRVLRSGVLPGTAAALAAGDISARHVQVIADAAIDAPAGALGLIEPEALDVARTADVRAVAGVMRQFRHALDPDGADEAALRRFERRGLSWAPTLDGSMALSGLADEVSGSTIATAIDAASPLVPGDRRSPAQRHLDGLVTISKRFLEAPDAPRRGHGGHPHVIVTTDATAMRPTDDTGCTGGNALTREPAIGAGSPGATLSWVGHIGGSTARRVACDAEVTTVTIGPDGEVHDTRTDRRFFTPAQRLAMVARDGDRCMWPWCDRPVTWADGHHLQSWQDGGPTTVANGALPCAAHHTALHEGGWTPSRLPDGRYVVRHRDGRSLGPEPHRPGHNRPPPHRRQ